MKPSSKAELDDFCEQRSKHSLSMRDQFAFAAMSSVHLVYDEGLRCPERQARFAEDLALFSYQVADAMLAQKAKSK